MEIEINENETYNLVLPEKVSIRELTEIIPRLQSIVKLGGNLFSMPVKKTYSKEKHVPFDSFKSNLISRADVVKSCQLVYYGNNEQRKAMAEKYGLERFTSITNRLNHLKKMHNITPKEVGVKRFPRTTKVNEVESVLIKGFKPSFKIEK